MGLPKASQNRQGEATLLLGGLISGQAVSKSHTGRHECSEA